MADPNDPWAAPSADKRAVLDELEEDVQYLDADSMARFGAYFVDSFILVFGLMVGIVAVTFVVMLASGDDALTFMESPGFDLFTRVFGFAAQIGYGTLFEGSGWHATPGKKLFGLQTVDNFNRPTDFAEALKRNLVKALMLACCGLLAFTAIGAQGLWNDQTGHRTVRRVQL